MNMRRLVLLTLQMLLPSLNDYIPPNPNPDPPTGSYNPTLPLDQALLVYDLSVAFTDMTLFMDDVQRAAGAQEIRELRPLVLAKKLRLKRDYVLLPAAAASLQFLEGFKSCLRDWFKTKESIIITAEVFTFIYFS